MNKILSLPVLLIASFFMMSCASVSSQNQSELNDRAQMEKLHESKFRSINMR